jgi:hypothetical protein
MLGLSCRREGERRWRTPNSARWRGQRYPRGHGRGRPARHQQSWPIRTERSRLRTPLPTSTELESRVRPNLLWCACTREATSAAGIDPNEAYLLGDAIRRHITPSLDRRRHPVPYLGSTAAVVDLLGSRLEQMDPCRSTELLSAKPRHGFARDLANSWRTETRNFRRGRAIVARRAGLPSSPNGRHVEHVAGGRGDRAPFRDLDRRLWR